jgi:putative SOS response-associated peptidase YedK
MPVILDDDAIKEWLKPENDYSDLRALLQPYGGQLDWSEAA